MSDKHTDAQGELPQPILRRKAGIGDKLVDFYSAEQVQGIIAKIRATEGQAQTSAAVEPLDMPLPCDITIGAMTIRKGVGLRTLVLKAQRLHKMVMPYLPQPDASQLAEFCRITGQDARDLPQRYKDMPALPESRYNGCGDGSEPLYTPEHMWDYAVAYAAQLADSTAPGAPVEPTQMTEEQAQNWAWKDLKKSLAPTDWNAGDSSNFFAFFLHGWLYRAQYERQRPALADPTAQQLLTAGGAVPEGYAMVPLYPTREMMLTMEEDGWTWEDLLGAAEAITDGQYAEIAAAPLPQVQSEALERAAKVCDNLFHERGGVAFLMAAQEIRALDHPPVTPSGALADNDGGVA